MSLRSLRRFGPWAKACITLGALALVLIHIDWTALRGLLVGADYGALGLAAIVLWVQFAIMTWRWRSVIDLLGGGLVPPVTLGVNLGRSMLIGQPLPSTVGGDVVRVAVLARRLGPALAARSVICDRTAAMIALAAVIFASTPFFAWSSRSGPALISLGAISGGALAVVGLIAMTHRVRWQLPLLGTAPAVLIGDLRLVLTTRQGRLVLLLGAMTHLLGVLLIYELAHAVLSPIGLIDCLMIVPATLLVSALPISLGGWGVREGALAAGFVMVGQDGTAGVAASILFGLSGPVIGVIAEAVGLLARDRDAAARTVR